MKFRHFMITILIVVMTFYSTMSVSATGVEIDKSVTSDDVELIAVLASPVDGLHGMGVGETGDFYYSDLVTINIIEAFRDYKVTMVGLRIWNVTDSSHTGEVFYFESTRKPVHNKVEYTVDSSGTMAYYALGNLTTESAPTGGDTLEFKISSKNWIWPTDQYYAVVGLWGKKK